MTTDHAATARELLRDHLISAGLDATIEADGVHTGIGDVVVEIRVKSMDRVGDWEQFVFWADIEGVAGMASTRLALDLLGQGPSRLEAIQNGVHGIVDCVIPVIRHDDERGPVPEDVYVMDFTSMTDGVVTAWDLFIGPPAMTGDNVDSLYEAIQDLLLVQGVVDTLVHWLEDIRPHWFKFAIAQSADGGFVGDMKVDGETAGLAPSFHSARWPAGALFVRQFGLIRPTLREPNANAIRKMEALNRQQERRSAPWWGRILGR